MFNTLCPKVYRRLRERAGLTQEELGDALGISRFTMNKVESGRAHLDESQEREMLERLKCNKEEFGELLCHALSDYLGKRVGIKSGYGAYEPSTALALAYALVEEHDQSLPANMRRALNNRITTTQLLGVTFDRNNADLVELAEDCRAAVGPKAPGRARGTAEKGNDAERY